MKGWMFCCVLEAESQETQGGVEKGSVWEHVSVNHCRQQKKRSHQQPAVTWTFAYTYPVEPNVCGAASVTDWVLGESMGDD